MPRKSLALFLATTGLITSLGGCGGGQDANEQGGDDRKSGQTVSPATSPRGMEDDGDNHDDRGKDGQPDKGGKQNKSDEGDQENEGGEGGEGGEG